MQYNKTKKQKNTVLSGTILKENIKIIERDNRQHEKISSTSAVFTAVLIMSSMIPLTILSLDTDETVRNF
jgi:hypothetical protein